MSNKKILGNIGENIALNYYSKLGYKLITKNYYSRYGEIDLVLTKDQQITLVEVKTRSKKYFSWPEESINQKKIDNIWKTYQILQRRLSLPPFFQLEALIIEINKQSIKLRRWQI